MLLAHSLARSPIVIANRTYCLPLFRTDHPPSSVFKSIRLLLCFGHEKAHAISCFAAAMESTGWHCPAGGSAPQVSTERYAQGVAPCLVHAAEAQLAAQGTGAGLVHAAEADQWNSEWNHWDQPSHTDGRYWSNYDYYGWPGTYVCQASTWSSNTWQQQEEFSNKTPLARALVTEQYPPRVGWFLQASWPCTMAQYPAKGFLGSWQHCKTTAIELGCVAKLGGRKQATKRQGRPVGRFTLFGPNVRDAFYAILLLSKRYVVNFDKKKVCEKLILSLPIWTGLFP